jgi:hypothetical protein
MSGRTINPCVNTVRPVCKASRVCGHVETRMIRARDTNGVIHSRGGRSEEKRLGTEREREREKVDLSGLVSGLSPVKVDPP